MSMKSIYDIYDIYEIVEKISKKIYTGESIRILSCSVSVECLRIELRFVPVRLIVNSVGVAQNVNYRVL
jgi:hypothetical protein